MAEQEETRGVALPYLRAWREYAVLTQEELAKASGVSRGTISAAETGGRVRLSNVERLAKALGTDRRALVHRVPTPEGERAPAHA